MTNLLFISTEKSGKTLHLLKSNSKPIKPRIKRKKVELLGTFAQYQDSKKKPAPDPAASQKQAKDVIMFADLPNTDPAGKEDLKKKK